MSQGLEVSDEFINAFIDNQVTPEDKAWAYAHLASDEAFNRRVCELRKIRDLIGLAYRDLSMPGQRRAAAFAKAAGYRGRHK